VPQVFRPAVEQGSFWFGGSPAGAAAGATRTPAAQTMVAAMRATLSSAADYYARDGKVARHGTLIP
jgi:hypothetical protein